MSEFDVDTQALQEELAAAQAPAGKAKKAKAIDPEDDRENWPVIYVDFEDNKPNYEYLHTSGTKKNGAPFDHQLQIQRGVDVKVPPSIVYMLQSTKQAHYRQSRDPVTGRQVMHRTDRSPIPWRLIEKGKYC